MSMYKRCKPQYEVLDATNHPDYEIKDTRVSDYLRKYGSGKIDDLPSSSAPEITDNRSTDQMLAEPVEHMSTETVDVLMEIEANKERFEKAVQDVNLTAAKKKKFDSAVKVIKNPNSTYDQKREAYSILRNLEEQGLITRARD